jgi:hypothetical protein
MLGKYVKGIKILSESLKEREHLVDLDVGVKRILK